MKLSDFDYTLPPERIARFPIEKRSESRLLVLDRQSGEVQHLIFSDLPDLLGRGDLLVCNDTRVIPARILGNKKTGGKIEILVERILDRHTVLAHVKGGGAMKPGAQFWLNDCLFEMKGRKEDLFELLCLEPEPVADVIDRAGEIPLPHYMGRKPDALDVDRYQTVFAAEKGSVAAPTASLHFDEPLLETLRNKGVGLTTVTLHIGAGTFAPVRAEDIREHVMHAEYIQVSDSVCDAVKKTKAAGRRVIAAGTTATRALESASQSGSPAPFAGDTSLFVYPGYRFQTVDVLITNFHLPRSSLLMLVSAFAGREAVLSAYQIAIEKGYRFYSYGDAMIIL